MSKVLKTAAVVVGAVALVASGIGAAAGVGIGLGLSASTLATIATVATVASVAAGALTIAANLTAGKPSASATGSQEQFSADPDAGIPLALGRTGTAGNITFRRGWDTRDAGDNDRQAFVATLSLGPIAAIEGMTVDKVPTFFSGTGAAIGAFAGFMWSMTQLGAVPEPAALGFGAGAGSPPGWSAQCGLSGKAAASWTLRFDTKAKVYQSGVPAPMWTVKGALAYDPTKDSTYPGGSGPHRMADPSDTAAYDAAVATWEWTENPYLLGLRWAHGFWQRDPRVAGSTYQRVMGMGAPWAGIDVSAFVEGRNIAQANGWTCGGIIFSGDEKWASMKKILQSGMGEPLALGAKISCLVNAPKVSLATITIDDVIGEASVAATQPRRNRFNTVTPRYRLEANNWQLLPGSPISVAEHVAEDRGKRSKVLDYPFIQNTPQVGTAVRYDIENAREFGPIVLPLKLVWMGYKPGDCVTADLPELGLNSQPILLLNRELDPSAGITTMTARSETTEKHAFALGQSSTPPPTPGVTGPMLIPVPGAAAWTISETSIVSAAATVPALIVTGAVDVGSAEGVVLEYRLFADGQAAGAGWVGAGVFSPSIVRQEIVSVQGDTAYEVAVSYRKQGFTGDRRVIGPVVTGGSKLDFGGVNGPTRPADNATNSADPDSPFGQGKVRDALQMMERVPLIVDDVSGLKDARAKLDIAVSDLRRDTDAAGVAIGALDDAVVDSAAARRQLEHDVGRLSGASLQLLLIADGLTQKLRDAGIVVDPTTGEVRIYAVDQLDGQMRATSVRLDAQRALIESKASSTEVDEKILRAVLSPEQIAQLEPLIARMASVEIAQDGIRAELRTKAELIELSKALERLTTAEQTISATDALVKTKVAQTAFDDAMVRLGSAETLLQSYGDISRYAIELRQAREDGRQGSAGLLAAVLAGNDASVRQITAQADLRQELTSSITGVGDRLTLEVRARTLLSAALGDLDARSIQVRQLLVKADAALAQDIDSLRSANDTQTGDIATLRKASVDAAGGITLLGTTLRQQVRRASEGGATMLAGVLAGDEASRRIMIGLAEVQSQLTTTLVAGFSAAASERLALRAQIDAADARYTREVQATADRFKSVTQAVTALEAEYGGQSDDIVATKATIAELARTTSKADEATVELINGLKAIVNDPVLGLGKTRTELTTLTDAVATDKIASGRRLDALEASVSDPETGLDATRAAIDDLVRVQADDRDAVAESIRQVSTTVGGHTSSIDFLLRSIDGEEAVAQLSVTAGGEVTGFRINGKDSVFAVAADRFIVGNSQIFEIDTTTGETVVNALKAGIVTAREIGAGAVQQTIFDITPADIVIQYG